MVEVIRGNPLRTAFAFFAVLFALGLAIADASIALGLSTLGLVGIIWIIVEAINQKETHGRY